MAFGSVLSGIGSVFSGAGGSQGLVTSLFGSGPGTVSVQEAGTTTTDQRQTEKLNLDTAAIQKIIEDVLGGAEGISAIFGGEQTAGIFDSSVAAQAAGNLASKLVGELAKLTAEKETISKGTEITSATADKTTEQEGQPEFEFLQFLPGKLNEALGIGS